MRSSFSALEFLRILLPGLYFALLALFFHWAWIGPEMGWYVSGVPLFAFFIFVAVVSGLSMYLRETPKRRKAFSENQPSAAIQNVARRMKGVSPLSDDDARRAYFYLLNNHMPEAAHEKIFFFGTIYHIVVHVRRTTFWFAILTTATLLFAMTRYSTMEHHGGLLLFAAVSWIVYALIVRHNKADRSMQENYQDQIVWLEMNRELVEKTLKGWKRDN